ncbi:MAG: BPSS1780 family membrane protein [Thiotrichales bacterium]
MTEEQVETKELATDNAAPGYQLQDSPRSCSASHGYQWIRDGFSFFGKAPLIWILVTIIFLAIMLLIGMVPMVSLLSPVLGPIFMGGFMLGCRAIDEGRPLQVTHLFSGFDKNTGSLAAVGGLYLAGLFLIMLLAVILIFLGGGGEMIAAMSSESVNGMAVNVSESMLLATSGTALIVSMLLYIPLIMLIWYAPALIVFHNVPAIKAMRMSFKGALINWVPFLLYGLIGMILVLIGIIPFGLGLLVVMPALIASVYHSYKDIFEVAGETISPASNELIP